MKTKIYFILSVIFLCLACSKKNNDNPTPSILEDTVCLLNNYAGVKDGAIIISEYKYDPQGKLIEEVIMAPNDIQYTKKIYQYNNQGKRTKLTTEFYAKDEIKDPFKLTQSIDRIYEYDAQGRFTKATDLHGSNPTLNAEYNDQNQLYKITGDVEGGNYLFLTYDDYGDVVKIERISKTNPAIRITQAQFEYDTSRPARILPEQMEVLHGLDFLVQKHLCKRAYYGTDGDGKPLVQVEFKIYKRTDVGKPEWEWVDVQWNTNPVRTYSLEYKCK